ncbi:hypothetical protein [[Clostridium] polysaccharolyticum]|jgi:hypothetical protein|uniref:Uncharacterized protein n=1 Tax=[Clostridium] polysaccharolyticum TaxID=29364 RepID=A0A1I0AWC8_9FIRM|nr:hypothetical protein [[Clostridium] polysaccharolyticum]SES98781.1 hypothetical protein SAMN04487772_10670 [[Clostridium] polysaccharolyticum]
MAVLKAITGFFMDFRYLLTATGYFVLKFLFFGGVAFIGTMLGILYRKKKNVEEQA